ncbi:3TM-type holin [Pyruvatibacter sp.]|uniref:3TM-type holin n=1 Tax=Pyruvatibacter sp. TaxID=1981328 RepID=UPI0032EDD823
MLSALLSFLGGPVASIIDKAVPDKEMAAKLKHELQMAALSNDTELTRAAGAIIKAEAQSEHPLTAQWRPILMLSITAILVNNYLLAPYAQLLFGVSVTLDLPAPMWNLLTVGVGGYVMGRSAEKTMQHWRGSSGGPH